MLRVYAFRSNDDDDHDSDDDDRDSDADGMPEGWDADLEPDD